MSQELDKNAIRFLLKAAQKQGCTVTEEDVLTPPTKEEQAKKKADEIKRARKAGLRIVDDELSEKIQRRAFELAQPK